MLLNEEQPPWCQVTPVCNFRQLYIALTGPTYLDVSSFILIWVSAINYHTFLDEVCKLPSQHRHNLKKKEEKNKNIELHKPPRVQVFQDVFTGGSKTRSFFLLSLEHLPFLSQYISSLDVSHRQCGINNSVRQTAFKWENSKCRP